MEMKRTGKTEAVLGDTSINITRVNPPNICVEMWGQGICFCN